MNKKSLPDIVLTKRFRRKRFFIVMKITTLLLFMFIFCLHAENTNSQNVSVTTRKNNVRLENILNEIEEQTNYLFIYNGFVDVNQKITVDFEKASLQNVLDKLFSNLNINYEIDGYYVILSSKKMKDEKTALVAQQQNKKEIQGIVTDPQGEPIIGANIIEKGTTNGIITGVDGRFSLITEPNAILQVSFIGFKMKEIEVKGRTMLKIELQDNLELLDEVVVVGYAVQKKANLSGSVATADTKKLDDRPLTSIGAALQGAVANLNVDPTSGDPNDLPSFNIRGFTSINGGSPLVVIDGVTSDMTVLNHLNPVDIANISVLKDASSAAIYGSRAAYGVILVTTKKGQSGKVSVNYNGNFDWRGLTVKPEYVDDAEIYFHDRNQASTGNPNSGSWPSEMFDAIKAWKADPGNNPNYFYHSAYDEYFYFDFFNPAETYIKSGAFSTNHNINVSGKSEKVNYYASGNYSQQDGLLKYGRNDYKQYNVRTKLDIQITPWWNLGSNTSMVSTTYKTNTYYLNKHDDSRDNLWSYGTVIEGLLTAVPFGPSYLCDNGYTYDWATQIGQMEQGGNAQKEDVTFNQLLTTRIDLIKDVLFVNGQFNYSLQKVNTDLKTLPFIGSGGEDSETWTNNEVSSAEARNGRIQHTNYDVYGTFHKKISKKHDLTAILGFNQEHYRYNLQNVSRDQLISTSVPSYNLAYGTTTATESTEEWALRGFYGRLGYIFNDRYIGEFNFRRDLTSRFPHNSRSVFSPSGSIAWVASQENFFKPLREVIDLFKIRASYGRLGNQDVSAYAYIPTMNASQYSYAIGGSKPMYVSTPGLVAGNLTWEKVTTIDLGIDLVMLNNRLSFTGDIYRRDTKDMLTTQGRDLPSVLGTAVPQENAADLKTVGWDLTVGWRDHFNLAGKPFNYNIDFTLSDSYAEITKVVNTTGSLDSYYVGQRLGEIWGLKTLGIFATDEEAKNWVDQSEVLYQAGKYPSRAGTIKFENRNNDNKISRGQWTLEDSGDYYKIGNSSIRYRFGLTLGAQWNGFDLSAFFQGVMKHQYYPGWYDRFFWGMYSIDWNCEPLSNYTDRWTEENQDVNKFFPRLEQGNAHSSKQELGIPQTRYLQNAAYVRLKNLTVGYTLPKCLLEKTPIERIRFYYSGENLFLISGLYDGYKVDPENLGFQYYPLQRHHSIGVNITF